MGGGASASGTTGAGAGGGGSGGVTSENVMRRDSNSSAGAMSAVAVKGDGLTLSVDQRSNTLIFFTTGARYQSLLPIIRRLDVPPKQILLEATIAEVTLTGEFSRGVEFAVTDGKWSGGTLGGLGLPSGGLALNYIKNVTDRVSAKLQATNGLVNVLSNPTLVVRDGVQASIGVGNDVPTVGAVASDPITSDRQITSVLYRKTGLNLQVRPTINAEGLVVLEIDQSISNTVPGSSGVSGAPLFFERTIQTEVVARSGEPVLLAGLISERGNSTSTFVPGLGQIPGLGWLFSSKNRDSEKTELVVLLTPRVVESPDEWSSILDRMRDSMHSIELPKSKANDSASPNTDSDSGKPAAPAVSR
jgi:general secretion pathway protein D